MRHMQAPQCASPNLIIYQCSLNLSQGLECAQRLEASLRPPSSTPTMGRFLKILAGLLLAE